MMMRGVRNIALIGHSGEGKTTLAEAILFNGGTIDRLGKTTDKNTVMDFDTEEMARGISISLGVSHTEFNGVKINLIDVPGFFDFEGEFISAMRAVASAILVAALIAAPTAAASLLLLAITFSMNFTAASCSEVLLSLPAPAIML
jgi:small GTP-binding protein